MRRPWSFWLTCLLLAALPLKGLAAAGVALCCPQAAAVHRQAVLLPLYPGLGERRRAQLLERLARAVEDAA